jgi:hypothetical protein
MALSRRRWLLVGITCAIAVPLFVLALFVVLSPSATILEVNGTFRVREGMTLEQVQGVLGSGSERSYPPEEQAGRMESRPILTGDRFFSWDSTGGVLWIGFRDGKVESKRFLYYPLF